jgi:hypothetical protein
MINTIPLSKLVASPRNVRRENDSQADFEHKADIEARGLIQNLVVTSVAKPRGCFAVEGGERRRRALQRLAEEGKLAPDHEVCCLVIDRACAQEAKSRREFPAPRHEPRRRVPRFPAARRAGLGYRDHSPPLRANGALRRRPAASRRARSCRLCSAWRRRDQPRRRQGLCRDCRPRAPGLCLRAARPILCRHTRRMDIGGPGLETDRRAHMSLDPKHSWTSTCRARRGIRSGSRPASTA